MSEPILILRKMVKRFDGIAVLHDVDFDVRAGEVHALVGENGAGKSTLMKLAAGIHQPDAGAMTLSDREYTPRNPLDALRAGIAMVHQELSLAPDVSVGENILVGREPRRGPFIDWDRLHRRAAVMLADFGLDIAPTTLVSDLGIGYRQVVEILKALASDPQVIIFDEPTSSLEAHETALVLKTIRTLAERSIGVVQISHRMNEVFEVADRVTVLRDGNLVCTRDKASATMDEIVNAMVGRELTTLYPAPGESVGDELLRVDHLTRKGAFRDISFGLHRGEILGFSGLIGAGRTELMRAIFGVDASDAGAIHVKGKPLRARSAHDAMRAGIAYLPEDRKTDGLFLDRSLEDNVVSASLDRCSRHGMMRGDLAEALAHTYSDRLSIRARDITQEVRSLSGGNQQKVLMARWMATEPTVLIVDEPTRGVDVGAKGEIHRMLRDYANAGHGVIVVSSEMPEILGLCDRIIVMHEGVIAGEMPRAAATEESLISLAVKH